MPPSSSCGSGGAMRCERRAHHGREAGIAREQPGTAFGRESPVASLAHGRTAKSRAETARSAMAHVGSLAARLYRILRDSDFAGPDGGSAIDSLYRVQSASG